MSKKDKEKESVSQQETTQAPQEEAVSQARQAAARGASILVARGLQAALIKRHTSIPVVEIVISA